MRKRDDFSVNTCIEFTKEVERIATRMEVTSQELIFTLSQMLISYILNKGMDIDEVMKLFKEFYQERREGRKLIIT